MFLFSTWITYILWDFVILNKRIEAYGNKTEPVVDVWQSKWCSANKKPFHFLNKIEKNL